MIPVISIQAITQILFFETFQSPSEDVEKAMQNYHSKWTHEMCFG